MDTALFRTRRKCPMAKTIKTANRWGGRRQSAGRPAGSRNKPRLIHGLPETPDPLQWLLALMDHEGATLHQRMAAAKAAMPYCHAMPAAGGYFLRLHLLLEIASSPAAHTDLHLLV